MSGLGRVAIVGRGRVGKALHAAFEAALRGASKKVRGRTRVELVRGTTARLKADTVILAVPDAALAQVALRLETGLEAVGRAAPVVLHVSGIRDASVLGPLAEAGIATGAMHPLASFASADAPPRLAECAFVISGAGRGKKLAIERARAVASLLGARPLVRRKALQGPRYHAAAALLANGAAALATEADAILVPLGLDAEERRTALAGLLHSVADNVGAVGTPRALTGPIVRGDAAAVALHLRSLSRPQAQLYAAVSRVILRVARAATLSKAQERAIARVLDRVLHEATAKPTKKRARSR